MSPYEQVLQQLEISQYDSEKAVYLLSYHSAKGGEFDHIYVIDQVSNYHRNQDNSQDTIRPLYVAHSSQTIALLSYNTNKTITYWRIYWLNKGKNLPFQRSVSQTIYAFIRFLQLEEIVLTPKALVSEEGRQFVINTFVKDGWGKSDDVFSRFIIKDWNQHKMTSGFYSPKNQLICQFSSNLTKN